MDAPPSIRNGKSWIVPHPARTRLVLFAAEHESWLGTPDRVAAACAEPLLGSLAHECGGVDRRRVSRSAQASNRDSEQISNGGVDGHAPFGARNILHRSANVKYA